MGGSGFIGNAIYKELCSYFDTYATYFTRTKDFERNKQFISYNLAEDDMQELLERVKPQIVISSLRGNFEAQIGAHRHIAEYVLKFDCKLYFISAANVFDAYSKYPSYENDKTLSESIYGRFKIKIENQLLRLPKEKWAILRVPMVFGNQSPRIREIKMALAQKQPIEVFPNLIINVTDDNKLTQQIHYLINRNKYGVYHLGSIDLVHHEDLIKGIVKRIGVFDKVIYKQVFTTNEERYLAVLPKENILPKNLQARFQQIIDHHISG